MHARSLAALTAGLLLLQSGALTAQHSRTAPPSSSQSKVAPLPLVEGEYTYNVTFRGNTLAQINTSLKRDSGSWVSTFAHSSTRSRTRFTDEFVPISYHMDVTGRQGPQGTLDLMFENGRMKGSQSLPDQMGGAKTFDLQVPPNTLFPAMEVERFLTMPLRAGMEIEETAFEVTKSAVNTRRYKVEDATKITVPAGTFEVFPIREVEDATRVLYVTTTAPRFLVKREVQAGATYELARIGG